MTRKFNHDLLVISLVLILLLVTLDEQASAQTIVYPINKNLTWELMVSPLNCRKGAKLPPIYYYFVKIIDVKPMGQNYNVTLNVSIFTLAAPKKPPSWLNTTSVKKLKKNRTKLSEWWETSSRRIEEYIEKHSLQFIKSERVSFVVSSRTNDFLLGNESAFFFLYWPGYLLKARHYQGGKQLHVSVGQFRRTDGFNGTATVIGAPPVRHINCAAFNLNNTCVETTSASFGPSLVFRGPFLILGNWWYPKDPFGFMNTSIEFSVKLVNVTPEEWAYLKSFKEPSKGGRSPVPYAIAAVVIAIGATVYLRRR